MDGQDEEESIQEEEASCEPFTPQVTRARKEHHEPELLKVVGARAV